MMGKETKENELSYIEMERVDAEVRWAGKGQGVQKVVKARMDNIFQAGELVSGILSMQKLDGCKGWCLQQEFSRIK